MSQLFGIVDCARDERLFDWVTACPEHTCLYAGPISETLKRASPHLAVLSPDAELTNIWRNEGRGCAWGILCDSSLDLVSLRRHLKKFLTATLPTGEKVIFRFYDPRVWRVYWPSLSTDEKEQWLKGATAFYADHG